MARRRRRRGGRRGSKAVPLVQTAILAYPALVAYKSAGFTANLPQNLIYQYTGIDAQQGKWVDPAKGVGLAVVLLGTQLIGSKIANRVGANRILKKVSGGMLKLM